MQLMGLIVVLIPDLTLEVGSTNPDMFGVAILGSSVVVKIIVNGFIPFLVRGVGVDGTIVCVRLGNLELLLLLTLLNIAKILHCHGNDLQPTMDAHSVSQIQDLTPTPCLGYCNHLRYYTI